MFNYSFNIRRLNSGSALKAFVTLIIDDVMSIEGFKIVNGRNGLFVSVPSHKGTVTEEGQQVEKYFDDVRFLGDNGIEVGNEIKNAMLDAYNNQSSSSSQQGGQTWGSKANSSQQRADSAQANTQAMSKPANKNKGKRRALWDDT
jgi:DNA-binding cell septation regulator SpoVG